MTEDWTNLIVGERMQVDQEFEQKVAASNFSRQQWSLIMTAVEFDVERADDPDQARLVAVTEKLPHVMDELDSVERSPMGMGADQAGAGGSGGSGGFLDGIKSALGLSSGGGGADREQLAAAEELAQMYADDLQARLESNGKWQEVRTVAQKSADD